MTQEMNSNPRIIIIAWSPARQSPEKNQSELTRIKNTMSLMGYEDLLNIYCGLNDKNAAYQVMHKITTARANNKKYYAIIIGNDTRVLLSMVKLHAENFIQIKKGNFVYLKNFQRHPETVWGYI